MEIGEKSVAMGFCSYDSYWQLAGNYRGNRWFWDQNEGFFIERWKVDFFLVIYHSFKSMFSSINQHYSQHNCLQASTVIVVIEELHTDFCAPPFPWNYYGNPCLWSPRSNDTKHDNQFFGAGIGGAEAASQGLSTAQCIFCILRQSQCHSGKALSLRGHIWYWLLHAFPCWSIPWA